MTSWGTRTDESNNTGWDTANNEKTGWHNDDGNNEQDSTTPEKYRKHDNRRETFNQELKKRSRDLG